MVLLLSSSEVEGLLEPVECFAAIEQVYRDLAEDRAVNRPRSHTFLPIEGREDNARYLFKTIEGGSASLGVYVLRLNSELWVPPSKETPKVTKIPSTADGRFTEFILLFSAVDGSLMALLPDGQIQKTRVALTHALAAKHLGREGAKTLGLFGSGWQAGAQATILAATRGISRIQIYSPTEAHRNRFADEMNGRIGAEVVAVDAPEKVMAGADIVIGATNSTQTVIRNEWVRPGMHISSVRSRSEIDPEIIQRADRIVVHNKTDSFDHWCGGLPPGLIGREVFAFDRKTLPQLSDIVAGKVQGRETPEDVTLFVDGDHAGGPGIGIQFAAVSHFLFEKAQRLRAQGKKLGQELPEDWFVDREDHPG